MIFLIILIVILFSLIIKLEYQNRKLKKELRHSKRIIAIVSNWNPTTKRSIEDLKRKLE